MTVTTTPRGAESLERALAATLAAHLPGELNAIWTAWAANDAADGLVVPLTLPKQYLAGERDVIYDYPAVVVGSENGRQTENGAGENWGALDHHLMVVAYLVGDDQHTLDIITKRYVQAIWEVLMKYQRLDGSDGALIGIDPGEYGRSPAHKIDIEPGLARFAVWSLTAHTFQNASVG